jgi:autotransporter-associated beta strand protein
MKCHRQRVNSLRAACVLVAAAVSLLAAAPSASAADWIGPGTDWNTAANWSPAVVPNFSATDVFFNDTGVGFVNISSGVVVHSITFTNSLGNYDLTSSAGQNLAISSITLAANVTGINNIDLATSATDSIQAPLFSNLTFTNNSVAGGLLVIGSSNVLGAFGGGSAVFQGAGDIQFFGTFTSTPAVQMSGLTKNGPGLLDYAGNGAALVGATTLNGGTLALDFGGVISQKAAPGASLVLDNGILEVVGNSKNSITQAYSGGTTITAGHTDITFTSGGRPTTLNLSAITRSAGGTTDFRPSTNFIIATTTGNTNGLLGTGTAFATTNQGLTWATASSGAIVGFTAYQNGIVGSGVNSDLGGGSFIGLIANSIRFSTANDSFNLLSPGTLQSGGILVNPFATGAAITGESLTASNGEFVFHVYSSDGFFVSSPLIASNGLTKTGPGNLTLAGNNANLTGPININRGNLTITTVAAVNSVSKISFNDGRAGDALQQFKVDLGDNTTGTVSTPMTLSAFSASDYGTYFSTGFSNNSFVTLSGAITSAPGLNTPIRFYAPLINSGFNLTNSANSFTGNISVYFANLGITSDAVLGNPANILVLDGVNAGFGGLVFLNSGINVARPVSTAGIAHITSNGADSNTISGLLLGNATIIKYGTGTLTLSNPNNPFSGTLSVNAGTVSLGATGGFSNSPNLTVNSGATFATGTTQTLPTFSTIILNGGTFRGPGDELGQFGLKTNQLVVGAGGTIDLTAQAAFLFALTGANASITVQGNATWSPPENDSVIATDPDTDATINIPSGVTLTTGIAFYNVGAHGFILTGGGTLFQNSTPRNQAFFQADLTISQGTYRITDISTDGHGNLGLGAFTLDGGTLAYAGATAATTHAIALTANGGSILVQNGADTLTINAPITGPGALTKVGNGTLALSSRTYALSTITVNGGTLALAGATFSAANFTNNSVVTGPATFNGGSFTNNGTFTNSGLLSSKVNFTNFGTFTQSGPQTWGAGTTFTNAAGTATFSSSPDAASAGHLFITVSGGTVSLASLDNLGALTLTGGTTKLTGSATTSSLSPSISVSANATLELAASYDFTLASAPALTGTGQIIIDPGATLSLRVDSAFAGTIVIKGTLFLAPALNPNAPTFNFSVLSTPSPVPEPASLTLLAFAPIVLRRRRSKTAATMMPRA